MILRLTYIFFLAAFFLAAAPVAAVAVEPEPFDLPGYEEHVSLARSPRPISRIAENISVITSEDIALLNAHTVAEVLQTVPGLQLLFPSTPGAWTSFTVNSIADRNVLVLLDGVPQTDLLQGFGFPSDIPAQLVERIEIIKGSASAAWGSALGGVVNIITKLPDPDRTFGGTGVATYGERGTSNLRAEVSGTADRFGYYLSGGNLHSRGIVPGSRVNNSSIYGKITYDLPTRGLFTAGIDYRDISREYSNIPAIDAYDTQELQNFNYFLSVAQPLGDRLTLELSGRATDRDDDGRQGFLSDRTALWKHYLSELATRAVGAKLSWHDGGHSLVTGFEYEHDRYVQSEPVQLNAVEQQDITLDRFGVYLNGAYSLGRFTLLPGIRFDHTGLASDQVSYTLGATYQLSDKTVIRGYGARGFNLPDLALGDQLQKIWTTQVGIESTAIPYLWLKGTVFYNKMWDIQRIAFTNPPVAYLTRQEYRGYELEGRTVPIHGLSLGFGYTFTDARDSQIDERIQTKPVHSLKLSGRYRNENIGLSGILTGNYVWWNTADSNFGRYKAIVWDLSLTQKLCRTKENTPELFFSIHNIFNGSQYYTDWYKNYGRWLEGGVRFRF